MREEKEREKKREGRKEGKDERGREGKGEGNTISQFQHPSPQSATKTNWGCLCPKQSGRLRTGAYTQRPAPRILSQRRPGPGTPGPVGGAPRTTTVLGSRDCKSLPSGEAEPVPTSILVPSKPRTRPPAALSEAVGLAAGGDRLASGRLAGTRVGRLRPGRCSPPPSPRPPQLLPAPLDRGSGRSESPSASTRGGTARLRRLCASNTSHACMFKGRKLFCLFF